MITCVVLLAIALAVGLGVGLNRRLLSATSDPASVPTSPPSPSLKNGVLNDTSLAAVTTFDGNRHLFFQDINGSIRHTLFDRSANFWRQDANYISPDPLPRNSTPLAAITLNISSDFDIDIAIFFIDFNDLLACVLFSGLAGFSIGNTLNDSFPVAPGSKTLSVAQMSLTQDNDSAEAVLMYEAPNSNITTLRGYLLNGTNEDPVTDLPTGPPFQWLWQNVSEAIYSSISSRSNTWLSSPLAVHSMPASTIIPQQGVCVAYFNLNALSDPTAPPVYMIIFNDWSDLLPNATQIGVKSADYLQIKPAVATQQSDLICFYRDNGPWWATLVQDQRLVYFQPRTPDTLFPFSRLAWLNDANSSTTFIYHQLDNSVLDEEAYYENIGWHPANVTISTST